MMTNAVVNINEYKVEKQYEKMNNKCVGHNQTFGNVPVMKKKLDPQQIKMDMMKGYIKMRSDLIK